MTESSTTFLATLLGVSIWLDILIYLTAIIGAIKILSFLISLLSFLNRQCLRRQQDLYRKYGNGRDSWAVVTGGSDGIGEQYCKDLAKQGFNICIIGRNQEKVNQKLQEIREGCGRVIETKAVIADLAKYTTISDYEKIADQVKDLDIAMLLLNAGVAQFYPFTEASNDLIEQMVSVNALHPIYLAKVLLN